MRLCQSCGRYKKPEKFNQKQSKCKYCTRDRDRARRYNIDRATYQAMLAAQCYCCAVCGDPFNEKIAPCVDHDHACCFGRIGCGACNRGLVCPRCNKVLGMVDDDQDILIQAVEYLNRGVQ